MNDNNDLKRYFRTRINNVIREISTPAEERTPETFHRLRVEIKKIKSLFSLIKYFDDKFDKRYKNYFESFKPVFKAAGWVRVLQIEDELMQHYKLNEIPEILPLTLLRKMEEKAIREFEKKNKDKTQNKIEKAGEKVEKHLNAISEKDLAQYNNHAFSEMKKLVQHEFKKKEMHEVRKQTKEFLYNLKLTIPATDKIIRAMNRLQDIIGKWHDRDLAIIHLNKIATDAKRINNLALSKLKQAIKKISDDNQKLSQQISEERKKLKGLLATVPIKN